VDKEAKKKEILKSAITLFARNGIANTKISDIAIEANMSKGNIYTYFESKEEIIKEAIRNYMAKLDKAGADQVAGVGDPINKLCSIIDAWMNAIISSYEETKLIVFFWAEGLGLDNVIDGYNLKEVYNNYRFFLSGILEEGISDGKIYPVDTKLMASVIIGALDGLVLHWIIGKDIFDLEKAIDLFKKSTIETLRIV